MKPRALKLYRASSWPLDTMPFHHRAANRSNQVTVAIRCVSKRRFAELLASVRRPADKRDIDSTYRHLSIYCSHNEVRTDYSQWDAVNQAVVKPDTIYYNPQHHCPGIGYVDQWFELAPLKETP